MKSTWISLVALLLLFWSGCRDSSPVSGPVNSTDPVSQLDVILPPPVALPSGDYPMTPQELQAREDLRIKNEQAIIANQSLRKIDQTNSVMNFDYPKSVSWSLSKNLYRTSTVSADATVAVTLSFDLHWDCTYSGLAIQSANAYVTAGFSSTAGYKVALTASVKGDYSVSLGSVSYTAGTLVGVVPVWVTITGQLDGGIAFNATGTVSLSQSATISANGAKVGASYKNGVWTPILTAPTPAFSCTAPTFTGSVNLAAQPYLKASVSAMALSVVGPRAMIMPYMPMTLHLYPLPRYLDRALTLEGDFYLSLGAIFGGKDLFDRQLFSVTKSLPRLNL